MSITQKISKHVVAIGSSKRLKVEAATEVNRMLEIEWTNYGDDHEERTYNMFEDEIEDDDRTLENSRVIRENDQGEEGQYILTLKLVDGRFPHRNTLASIVVEYWPRGTNLQTFNEHSQELSDFSYDLWEASGRDMNSYDVMAVEFGTSPYSFIEIPTLVDEATAGTRHEGWCYQAVMYVRRASNENSDASRELLQTIFNSIAALMVIHKTDLEALGLHSLDEYNALGFVSFRNGWFGGRTF